MTELLILSVLLEGNKTIYGLKKRLDELYQIFFRVSFGSIHPALQKLEKDGHVFAKIKMSKGGQKSSTYSISAKGKKYFERLMQEELPENPTLAEQLIKIKILLIEKLSKNNRQEAIDTIIFYLEKQLIKTENFLMSNQENINADYLKHHINKTRLEINWLKSSTF